MFEQLSEIHVDSSKHSPVLLIKSFNINATNNNFVKKEDNEYAEVHLSLSPKELINEQNNDTFIATISKLGSDKKMPMDRYFIND